MELNLTGRSGHGTPEEFATLSAILIDGDDIFIDNGAIHGKSRLERGVDFRSAKSADDVPNGRSIPVIWVVLKRYEGGMGYSGLVSSSLVINEEKVGYKNMAGLVNAMDGAMKGKVSVGDLTAEQRAKLRGFLAEARADLWANTPEETKAVLA